jgi:hypothetical protein
MRIVFLLLVCLVGPSHAHDDEDLRSGDIRPRTAYASEEVVRQKLATYGLTGVRNLRRDGAVYRADARRNLFRIQIEVDAATGLVREAGEVVPLTPAWRARRRVVEDHTVDIPRAEIAARPTPVSATGPHRVDAMQPMPSRPDTLDVQAK